MSLCGTVIVITKKRKRKHDTMSSHRSIDDTNDDSISLRSDISYTPLSYTYNTCDNCTIQNDGINRAAYCSQSMTNSKPTNQNYSDFGRKNDVVVDDTDDVSVSSTTAPPPFQWLNWRMDPIKTFSDWTIDVIVLHTNHMRQHMKHETSINPSNVLSTTTVASSSSSISNHPVVSSRRRYHVHKNVLVVESQIFQSLFMKDRINSAPRSSSLSSSSSIINTFVKQSTSSSMGMTTTTNTTEVLLSNEYEANIFPTFLDYMYSPGSIWINEQNATTMLVLSQNFHMKRLQWLVRRFLKYYNIPPQPTQTSIPGNSSPYVTKSLALIKSPLPMITNTNHAINVHNDDIPLNMNDAQQNNNYIPNY